MLRTTLQRSSGVATGIAWTITHALGAVPDFWSILGRSGQGLGRTYAIPGTVLTNAMCVRNSNNTQVTVDVTCIVFQGRLY